MFPTDPYPFLATTHGLVVIFIIALALFHAVFVFYKPTKLTRMGWKRSDYFWVLTAALGLVGAAGHSRQSLAKDRFALANSRMDGMTTTLDQVVGSYTKDDEYPCQAPAIIGSNQKLISDFRLVCDWGKALAASINTREPRAVITPTMIPPDPKLASTNDPAVEPLAVVRDIKRQIDSYNTNAKEYEILIRASEPSGSESTLDGLAPLLLAITLAFRLTKVTGEVRIERQKA